MWQNFDLLHVFQPMTLHFWNWLKELKIFYISYIIAQLVRQSRLNYQPNQGKYSHNPSCCVQQGLEIHGLEQCGPWRYTVFNWFPKHLRYTVLGQKPWRCTVFFKKQCNIKASVNLKVTVTLLFIVRNHVKLRGFSKDSLLFCGFWLWAWRISWGLQTCIAERSKVPNG